MSFDPGSPAIEIAIALSFVFFLLSLIASAIAEAIAALFKFRSKNLKKGLEGMVGDQDVVRRLFCHPLVRTDLHQEKDKDPSYISSRTFALAFLDTVDASKASAGLSQQLSAMTRSNSAALPDVPALERWFDESMDRVSGWYRRKSQIVTFVIAVVLVIGLNVSAIRVAEQLSAEPAVRAAVLAKAEAAVDKQEADAEEEEEGAVGADSAAAAEAETASGEEKPEDELVTAGRDMEQALDQLSDLKLAIFWVDEAAPDSREEWAVTLAGWLIAILAVSLGAPFWFDTLNKLSNLRLAGKKPEETAAKKPAA